MSSSAPELDIVTLGRAAIDLNAADYNRPMRETRSFTKYVGGSPVNIAINAAKLGLNAGFIGKISSDQHGEFIMDYLREVGVDTDQVVWDQEGHKSGLTFTEIINPEECNILMYREDVADLYLDPAELSEEYIRRAKYLLISGTALAKSPSREAVLKAVELARRNNVKLIFELDYRPYSWKSLEEVSVYYTLVAQQAEFIMGTRDEFDFIAKSTDEELAQRLFLHDAKLLVIKHGIEGAKAYQHDGEVVQAKAYKSNVLKTFGAGDSFAAAFLYAFINERDLETCLKFGNAAASIVISRHSSSESMPTVQEIEEVIEQGEVILI